MAGLGRGRTAAPPFRGGLRRLLRFLRLPGLRLVARHLVQIVLEVVHVVDQVAAEGRRVVIRKGTWPIPPGFGWLQMAGSVDEAEMHTVFNMGIGFVMIVSRESAAGVVKALGGAGYPSQVIGEVKAGEPGVEFA